MAAFAGRRRGDRSGARLSVTARKPPLTWPLALHWPGVSHPVRIAPSLLAADFARLADEVRCVEDGGADWLHLDIMDGCFVPNLTFGPCVVEAIHKVARRPLDVHLMIRDPWQYVDAFLDAGAHAVTFHIEVEDQGDVGALLARIRQRGCKAGLSLQPDTPAQRLEPYLGQLDLVLVMSVFAGFGGQKFMPEVLDKPGALRSMGYTGELSMDGGIGPATIGRSASAGTNVFVAGSAVFGGKDRAARIAELRALAEQAGAGPAR